MLINTPKVYEKIGPGRVVYGKKSGLYKMLPCIYLFQGEKLLL